MADPLTLAATAAGVLSLGFQVTQGIFSYVDALESQQEELLAVKSQNNALFNALAEIRSAGSQLQIPRKDARAAVSQSLDSFMDNLQAVEELLAELAHCNTRTSVTRLRSKKNLSYDFDRQKLQDLSKRLGDANFYLQHLALHILPQVGSQQVQWDTNRAEGRTLHWFRDEDMLHSEGNSNDDILSQASDLSSATRFSTGSHESTATLIASGSTEWALFLRDDTGIGSLCVEALLKKDNNSQNLERKLADLLRSLATGLAVEYKHERLRQATELLRRRSRYIARDIIRLSDPSQVLHRSGNDNIKDYLKSLPEPAPDSMLQDVANREEEAEPEEDEELDLVEGLRSLLRNSTALAEFQRRFRNIIRPTFHSSFQTLVENYLSSAERIPDETRNLLAGLVLDLQGISRHDICDVLMKPSSFDVWKFAVEKATAVEWSWWPFLDPPRPPEGLLISWRCECGTFRRERIPRVLTKDVQKMLQKYTSQPRTSSGQANITVPTSTPIQSIQNGQDGPAPLHTGQSTPFSRGASTHRTMTAGHASSHTVAINVSRRIGTVFIAIGLGQHQFDLAQIDTSSILTDDHFFARLEEKYTQMRGLMRCWLSYMAYHHCNFVHIVPIREHEFEPGTDHPAFPDGTLAGEYEFVKPPKPLPPIGEHEFWRRFYLCHQGGTAHRHWIPWLPCRRKCARFPGAHAALDRIPKRVNSLVDDDYENRTTLWGLVAVEKVSFIRVAVYHLLILSGPFAFWFIWLYLWDNAGDLQTAAVPFTTVITAISLFWFPLLSRDASPRNG